MKYTAMQQAILAVRKRMESQNETLMGKHTAHHLQQVERDLHLLLKDEKEQIIDVFKDAYDFGYYDNYNYSAEQYYKETYEQK